MEPLDRGGSYSRCPFVNPQAWPAAECAWGCPFRDSAPCGARYLLDRPVTKASGLAAVLLIVGFAAALAPLLVSTEAAQETEGFALVCFLGLAFLLEPRLPG